MSGTPSAMARPDLPWELPSRGRVGMFSLIAAEAAIFIIFVVAYLFYAGKSLTGPMPKDVLRTPVFYTVCLLSSSLTIHFAIRAVRQGSIRTFRNWWFGTVALGAAFLYGTAREWYRLIFEEGLTIRTQSVWDDILFIGRLARLPRDCGSDLTLHGLGVHVVGTCRTGARVSPGRVVSLLAFRGRSVGSRLHRGLHHRAISRGLEREFGTTDEETRRSTKRCYHAVANGLADRPGIRHTLVFAGMLTTASVSILGAILALTGYVGWFRDVLPHEKHESVPVLEEPAPVATSRPVVARANWITHDLHRARLPLETYPISAGVKGGLAGSVAMAVLAMAYGLIVQHSVWYPINLLAAGLLSGRSNHRGSTCRLSTDPPDRRYYHSPRHIATGRASLWRHASYVSAPPDPVGRCDRASLVVGSDP